MKRHYPLRYSTLMRLVRSIHANAARLFVDACTLYRERAYPSAYAFSILAYEELGKLEMVDHVGFEEMLSHGVGMTAERMEHLFSRKMFYSHRNKQAWGSNRGREEQRIYAGALERDKQNAIYVGFVGGRIRQPTRYIASHAYKQLCYTLRAFEEIADIPFYGVHQQSTHATRRHSQAVVNRLRKALARCPPPRRKFKTR